MPRSVLLLVAITLLCALLFIAPSYGVKAARDRRRASASTVSGGGSSLPEDMVKRAVDDHASRTGKKNKGVIDAAALPKGVVEVEVEVDNVFGKGNDEVDMKSGTATSVGSGGSKSSNGRKSKSLHNADVNSVIKDETVTSGPEVVGISKVKVESVAKATVTTTSPKAATAEDIISDVDQRLARNNAKSEFVGDCSSSSLDTVTGGAEIALDSDSTGVLISVYSTHPLTGGAKGPGSRLVADLAQAIRGIRSALTSSSDKLKIYLFTNIAFLNASLPTPPKGVDFVTIEQLQYIRSQAVVVEMDLLSVIAQKDDVAYARFRDMQPRRRADLAKTLATLNGWALNILPDSVLSVDIDASLPAKFDFFSHIENLKYFDLICNYQKKEQWSFHPNIFFANKRSGVPLLEYWVQRLESTATTIDAATEKEKKEKDHDEGILEDVLRANKHFRVYPLIVS